MAEPAQAGNLARQLDEVSPSAARSPAAAARFFTHRSCLDCGATSPGSRPRSSWYRHPVTGAEWLCERCRKRAYQKMRAEQRRAAKAAAAGGGGEGGGQRAEVEEDEAAAGQAADLAAEQVPPQPAPQKKRQSGKRRKQAPAAEQQAGQQGKERQERKQPIQPEREQQQGEKRKKQKQEAEGHGQQQAKARAGGGAAAAAATEGQQADSDAATSSALGMAAEEGEPATAEGGVRMDEQTLQESCLLLLLAQCLEAGMGTPWALGWPPADAGAADAAAQPHVKQEVKQEDSW
ncbi:hypothetical protein ABPG75_002152 [Micractinium tetrahymenae]